MLASMFLFEKLISGFILKNKCWGVKENCFYALLPKIISFEISFEKAFLTICELCNGFRSEKVDGKGAEMSDLE